MTEKEFSESVINKIESYFIVKREVYDKSGKNRIDYLFQIPNTEYYFGIEFKQFIKMANLTTSPNLWAGEYTEGINLKMQLGGDTVKAGLWRVVDSVEDKAIVKLFNYGSRMQVGTICTATRDTASTMADKVIPVTTFTVSDKVCKQDLINTNASLRQSRGALFTTIPDEVINAYLDSMAGAEMDNMERIRWSGDTTSADAVLALQDGLIKKIKGYGVIPGAGYVRVTPASATASQDAATVIAELNKVVAAASVLPTRRQVNFKIVVSPEVASAYEQALAASGSVTLATLGLGQINQSTPELTFLGYFSNTRIPMYVANGLRVVNKEVILAGCFSNDEMGNLLMATDALSDFGGIIVQDRQAVIASQAFIDILWSVRQGVDVARPTEIVLYHS